MKLLKLSNGRFAPALEEPLREVTLDEWRENPQAHAEPPEETVDSAPLDPDYSGLNSIKSRSMRSLVVKREY